MLYDKNDIQSIFSYAKSLEGKKFKDVGSNPVLFNNTKGGLGQFIEEEYFGYKVNSRSEADFFEAGLELKVTPYKTNKNGTKSAKERLVLNIINYMDEVEKSFDESSFWTKSNKILLVFYEWLKDVSKEEYEIRKVLLFQYPEEDLIIIKRDWEEINEKIKNGLAHTISEGDTLYLGACTKGANKNSLRQQPNSNILAKQRAYSLKQSYMTSVLNKYAFGSNTSEKIIKDYKDIQYISLEQYILGKYSKYYNKRIDDLKQQFNIKGNPKQYVYMIASKILGVNNISKTEEIEKANIKIKTVRLEKDGHIEQSMSFPGFKFKDLVKEEWEESTLRTMFYETKFLIFVTQKNCKGDLIFKKALFWNMPIEVLDGQIKDTWLETVRIIQEGVKLVNKNGMIYNNLPGIKFNGICHVRPHTSVSSYEKGNPNADELPDGRWMTKQCFWLDRKYVRKFLLHE
ncbi:restriction endonuclease [Mycoplasmatota bacterium]|nr:restriction endonuclease [Mycoplasmatota bacterium]